MGSGRIIHHLLRRRLLYSSSFCRTTRLLSFFDHSPSKCILPNATIQFHNTFPSLSFFPNHPSSSQLLSTSSNDSNDHEQDTSEEGRLHHEISEDEESDGWEEEEEVEAKPGDGGDGGGVVLQGIPWGERVLSIAREVLLQFADDLKLYSFKINNRGYVYVRLDKLSNEYGCPTMEELESYCQEYKKRLEEVGALGEIPDNLALEVSSPGAERILKVPDELSRFKDMPMRVNYVEGEEPHSPEKEGVFFLETVETELDNCVWKLADVKENRDPESKGRPLSRKRRDWRLNLPFTMHRRVTLYLEF
ncbi:uncharacterized protein [Euphorbia lathyris]|uniref:uncharacterized protein n=1 Tax=Euphorbia lathyris TaxID=212925 RepID=UPI0033142D5C